MSRCFQHITGIDFAYVFGGRDCVPANCKPFEKPLAKANLLLKKFGGISSGRWQDVEKNVILCYSKSRNDQRFSERFLQNESDQ